MDVPAVNLASRAYVTFLAGNKDYVKGVVGLAKGLRKAKSQYPLVVAVLPDVPEEHRKILQSQGCIVRDIEPVYPPENHQAEFAMAYYVINYSKLRIFNVRIYICRYRIDFSKWRNFARLYIYGGFFYLHAMVTRPSVFYYLLQVKSS